MKTDIVIVLDRSGSMSSVAGNTIEGFNRFLDDQKKAPGSATLTLNQFDHQYERIVNGADIHLVAPLTGKTFVPRGMTALLDAIGKSINDTGDRLRKLPASERPDKVIVVIMTDGHENASQEFTRDQIQKMVEHQRGTYAWEFVFLGANMDAIATARSYGFDTANTITYASNDIGTRRAFRSLSSNATSMRTGLTKNMSFTASDRTAQTEAGA